MGISEKIHTPHWIFIVYVLVCSLLIMVFRFIFSGSEVPLIYFSGEWRMIQGVLAVLNLFPALSLSALVIPFGVASLEEEYKSFSKVLFKRLVSSVIIAICAAALYAAIFFLVFPSAKNYEENLRFKGELFHHAKEQMQENYDAGNFYEASRYLAVCDQIWPGNKDFNNIRFEIEVRLRIQSLENGNDRAQRAALLAEERDTLGRELNEVNSTRALFLSEEAFAEKRYFDAHWLAALGGRLSAIGSEEAARASRLASDAWNMITSLTPNLREEEHHALYAKKVSGFQAMNSDDWIQAYYIFLELITLTPDDTDVKNFLAASELAAMEYAFFIDDIKMSIGDVVTGAVFSVPNLLNSSQLPDEKPVGRTVLRFKNLSALKDEAYGMGLELMEFDQYSHLITSVQSTYAKLLPVKLNDRQQIMILTHALDRYDNSLSEEGNWLMGNKEPKGLILDISYEDFLLLINVRKGLLNLQFKELFQASQKLGEAGYITEIFEAELLNRLGSAVFFLPAAILVILIGWRFRAKTKPRLAFFLALPALPAVFYGFVYIYRTVLNLLGIWLVLTIGFSAALAVFIIVLALSTFFSLLALAAQHS